MARHGMVFEGLEDPRLPDYVRVLAEHGGAYDGLYVPKKSPRPRGRLVRGGGPRSVTSDDVVRGDESRRRRGREYSVEISRGAAADVNIPWRSVAATPRT